MDQPSTARLALAGFYSDVLRDPDGRIRWDSGIRKNVIVADCRRLLAAFMHSTNAPMGIQGIKVGAGKASWDQDGTPPPDPTTTALRDPSPYVVPVTLNYLTGANVSGTPTNRLQIVATLGPGIPPGTNVALREFGLFGKLDGNDVLIDYVTHPVIIKDPASTLDRTVWLVF